MYLYDEATMSDLVEDTDASILAQIQELEKKREETVKRLDEEIGDVRAKMHLRNVERRNLFLCLTKETSQ